MVCALDCINCYSDTEQILHFNNRQGMAPVLEMAMVAKLLMILIDTTMMWDVPKKRPDKLHQGKVAVYSA